MAKNQDYVQADAFEEEPEIQPVDREKKDAYRKSLADNLHDPEFRKIEGFPMGATVFLVASFLLCFVFIGFLGIFFMVYKTQDMPNAMGA